MNSQNWVFSRALPCRRLSHFRRSQARAVPSRRFDYQDRSARSQRFCDHSVTTSRSSRQLRIIAQRPRRTTSHSASARDNAVGDILGEPRAISEPDVVSVEVDVATDGSVGSHAAWGVPTHRDRFPQGQLVGMTWRPRQLVEVERGVDRLC